MVSPVTSVAALPPADVGRRRPRRVDMLFPRKEEPRRARRHSGGRCKVLIALDAAGKHLEVGDAADKGIGGCVKTNARAGPESSASGPERGRRPHSGSSATPAPWPPNSRRPAPPCGDDPRGGLLHLSSFSRPPPGTFEQVVVALRGQPPYQAGTPSTGLQVSGMAPPALPSAPLTRPSGEGGRRHPEEDRSRSGPGSGPGSPENRARLDVPKKSRSPCPSVTTTRARLRPCCLFPGDLRPREAGIGSREEGPSTRGARSHLPGEVEEAGVSTRLNLFVVLHVATRADRDRAGFSGSSPWSVRHRGAIRATVRCHRRPRRWRLALCEGKIATASCPAILRHDG